MRVIYPDNITSVEADAENANFPDDNLLDKHPKKLWKGTGNSHTVLAVVTSGSGFAIFNTNATGITATILSGLEAVWDSSTAWHSGTQWFDGDMGTSTVYELDPAGVGSMWGDYIEIDRSHILQLEFVADSGTVLEAGVLVAGTVNTFNDPKYGINEGLFDFSIVKELNNGAIYTRKRDTVRTFSWSILDDRDPDFYTFFRTIGQQIGPDPLAWRIVHIEQTDWEWVTYCRFNNMPSGQHRHITQSDINANLIEVV